MTIHTFIESLRYKWKAKGRHGIHSPFVYDFAETVLQDRKKIAVQHSNKYPGITEKCEVFFNRITSYYGYKNIQFLPAGEDHVLVDPDVLLFPAHEPLLWVSLANRYFHMMKNNSAVFVPNIHETAAHTHEWNRLCRHQDVLMSIDLYEVGLLFFKDEFKERQQFVLKY